MQIDNQNMQVFYLDLKTTFANAYQQSIDTALWRNMAMTIQSNTAASVHGWVKQWPQMREWIGDRYANAIGDFDNLTVKNRKFELTIEVPRTDFEDDQYGWVRNWVTGSAAQAASYPEQLLMEALLKGNSSTWIDNVAFFSAASRSYNGEGMTGNTIANYSTNSLTQANFNTAISTMQAYKGYNGLPLNVKPMALLHGPALRTQVFEILRDDFAARQVDTAGNPQGLNPNKNYIVPIQSNMLIDGLRLNGTSYDAANYWFIIGEMNGLRGLVWQERQAAELQDTRMMADSDFVFAKDAYQLGVRMRGEAFLSIPHLIYGSFAT